MAGAPTTIYGQGGGDTFDVAVTRAGAYADLTLDGGGNGTVNVFDLSGGATAQSQFMADGTGEFDMSYADGSLSRIHNQNVEQVSSNALP
jgi:hypothetical protein